MTGEPMSDAEIREALSRAERATSGPWEITAGGGHKAPSICCPESYHACGVNVVQADRSVISSVSYTNEVCEFPMQDVMGTPEAKAVAEFIAHARTDVPRLAADLLAARAERDLALSLRNTATNVLADVVAHRDSLAARCRELEGALKPFAIAGVTNADMECERMWAHDPSMRVFLRPGDETTRCALVRFGDFDRAASLLGIEATVSWPPPSHTCQIHRATSGASDCGLSPREEATVHGDRGAARPAENATPEAVKCATCGGGEWVLDPPHAPDCDTPVPAGIRHSHRLVWCKCGARGHECPDCGGGA